MHGETLKLFMIF